MAASLQTRVIFGLKTDIQSNAHYITDNEILYPVGNALAVHNVLQRHQRLIRLPDKYEINIICLSPNKKYVALSETGEKPVISIYDVQTLKRRKILGIPYDAPEVTKFNCMAFSYDSKYLAAVTSEPDQTMLYYNWERGKVETSFKAGTPQNPSAIVNVVACNPTDGGVVALAGRYVFKCLTMAETVWRPYGFSKADNIITCSMAWLNTDRLLLGTHDGKILYLENGDLKNVYKVSNTVSMSLKIKEEYVLHGSGSLTALGDRDFATEHKIRCLIAFDRGFAFAYGLGEIILFEKQGQHKYVKRNIYQVPPQPANEEDRNLYAVNALNINPSMEHLIVTTGWPQLFYATLWGLDLNKDPEPQMLKILGPNLHYGAISSLSTCVWKPIFMTCGQVDQSVRLWDFEKESLILHKQYSEDIYSVALHPTGLFCLIGFSDKLRFMTILIDDLLPMEELPIRSCRTVAFCFAGHLFAAVSGNIVQIYTTIGYHNRFTLKGHTGRVEALVWSQTDTKLLTLGTEGSIYQWDISTGLRCGETILKGMRLHDIALTSDESVIYFIADDSYIREIKEELISREFQVPGLIMRSIVLGKEDQVLFMAIQGGVILSFRCPLQEPVEFVDFHIHCVDITKMALSFNEQYLVSTAKDGSLCISKLMYPEGRVGKVGKEIPYTNEVLISKADLEEKIQLIGDLTVRLRELETENAYKLRQIEIINNDKIREIHQGYYEAIEELKDKIDKLQDDHATEINGINVEIARMQAAHKESMKEMESNYNAKLINEYDRYQALEERTNAMRNDYERRLSELEKQKDDHLQEVVIKYEAQVHEKKLQIEEAQDEISHQARVHEKLAAQIEEDADQEILELRTKYEALLHEEKELNLRLKGEAGVMRNRYIAGQKDIEDLKRQAQRVQSEYGYFQKNIANLEKDIIELKNQIVERDSTIQDKEKEIYDLKRGNQELEKFKFVLNYKITELKSQIEPRDLEIKDLKNKIRDMEVELINLHKCNVSLELQLHELREKLGAARREFQGEVEYRKQFQQLLKKIRVDILEASGLVQEPQALKTAVTNLYHKYSADEDFQRSWKTDLEVNCEFRKQRDHLEKTIASLKKQIAKVSSSDEKQADQTVEENVMLIAELNALREELKESRRYILQLERVLPPEKIKLIHKEDEILRSIGALKGDLNRGFEK